MANKIVLNSSGIREVLKSDEIAEMCREEAEKIRNRAGEGFAVEVRNYPERTGYAVYPETEEAFYRNLNKNTLLKAIG